MDGGAWWAAIYRVAQSRTWLKQLSSSSSGSVKMPLVAWWELHWIYRLFWVVTYFHYTDSSDPWTWYISPSICHLWFLSSVFWRKWQPTSVFLPGKSHGGWNLVGYSPWGHKESDTTEQLNWTMCMYVCVYIYIYIYINIQNMCYSTVYIISKASGQQEAIKFIVVVVA